jgi:hypothetical protein
MVYEEFNTWKRHGHAKYIAELSAAITPPIAGSTSLPFISTTQKDDDAALISWNRKPRDVAKYPILKTDSGYPDWRLKMKRQLITDILQ